MKTSFSLIGFSSQGILAVIAFILSTAGFAKDVETIGYEASANSVTMQVRKVETNLLDGQKRLAMKTILYVHDTENDGKVQSQILAR